MLLPQRNVFLLRYQIVLSGNTALYTYVCSRSRMFARRVETGYVQSRFPVQTVAFLRLQVMHTLGFHFSAERFGHKVSVTNTIDFSLLWLPSASWILQIRNILYSLQRHEERGQYFSARISDRRPVQL